jgi:hypothetical protein
MLPTLSKMAQEVIFVPQQELLCVLDEMVLGVHMMSPEEFIRTSPAFDYHISLASLLLRFEVRADNLPKHFYYLKEDTQKMQAWKAKVLAVEAEKRIGFAWQGNPKHTGDKQRSAPLEAFGSLAKIDGLGLFCLQKELDAQAFAVFAQDVNAIEFCGQIDDFADTLALINALDIVVSVDTSVAHLAASAGKTVWLLVAYVPDWRWGTCGEVTGWYENIKLFRQQKNESWEDTVKRLAENFQG